MKIELLTILDKAIILIGFLILIILLAIAFRWIWYCLKSTFFKPKANEFVDQLNAKLIAMEIYRQASTSDGRTKYDIDIEGIDDYVLQVTIDHFDHYFVSSVTAVDEFGISTDITDDIAAKIEHYFSDSWFE